MNFKNRVHQNLILKNTVINILQTMLPMLYDPDNCLLILDEPLLNVLLSLGIPQCVNLSRIS